MNDEELAKELSRCHDWTKVARRARELCGPEVGSRDKELDLILLNLDNLQEAVRRLRESPKPRWYAEKLRDTATGCDHWFVRNDLAPFGAALPIRCNSQELAEKIANALNNQ